MWAVPSESAVHPDDPVPFPGRRRAARAVVVALALAFVLASCGSGDDEPASDALPDVGDESTSVTVAPGGSPTPGGTLVYGIEAESAGWDPTADRFSTSGWTVAWTFYDALAAFDDDGNAQPYLARSFEPSEDYRTWTIRLRPDVRFHNGEVLDGAALELFFGQLLEAPLSKAALANISSVEVAPDDPLAVVVTMAEPWATFPANLTLQVGMVPAPSQLASSDRAVRSARPVGTGPFEFEEWVTGDQLRVVRNAEYWQTDEAGASLPYLDAIEFRIIAESVTRQSAIVAGDVDLVHMNLAPPTAELLDDARAGELQVVFDPGETEEVFILFNTAVAPLDDVRVRQALVAATDVDTYLQT
ncbi:MAG: ABC transporter substrate-binding protein, partial [Acidimicrobiales bacterium]|nr:ABC transporter substrate-binding protein [Acidimicrobiales bacterium]